MLCACKRIGKMSALVLRVQSYKVMAKIYVYGCGMAIADPDGVNLLHNFTAIKSIIVNISLLVGLAS